MLRHSPSRAALAAMAGLFLLTTSPMAQQYVLSPAERARLAAIDFLAVDDNGTPIRDLRVEDITVRIDGRTRPITSLEWVPAGHGPRVPAPFASNRAVETQRTVLLIIDDETLRPGREQELKNEVRSFVRALAPADRVAVVTVPYGGMKSDFTSNADQVLAAVDAITGRAPQTESEQDANCRTRSTLVAIAGTLDSIAATDAPLTTLIFTGGLTAAQSVATPSRRAGDVAGVTYMNTIGTCEVLPDHYQAIGTSAARARAQVFVVQPDLGSDTSGRTGLEHLTGLTGGPLWNLLSPTGNALSRVLTQTAGHYVARIAPEPNEPLDLVRGVAISTQRPGITVRHRPRLVLHPSVAAPPPTTGQSLLDVMRETRVRPELPLRVAATTSRHSDGQIKLVVQFEAPDSAQIAPPMVGLFDASGRMVVSNTATAAEVQGRSGMLALAAPEGQYRLRLIAADASGTAMRVGSVDLPVDVRLGTVGPLRLSGLVFGQARPEGFVPRLEFQNEISAVVMLEVYGGQAGTPVGVAFEVASTKGGPPLATMRGTISPTSEPDKFLVSSTLPVGALPPGDYEVRAVFLVGESTGHVSRTLRKLPPQ